ncbi:hypothetical protein [Streptomyces acidicola]|uniref:hypothetical protein n=1 Tax=Streptomyces acidicola TaxID=2596892 RepID=UPI0037F67887
MAARRCEAPGFLNADGVAIRTFGTASCAVVGRRYRLQAFNVDCWTDGTNAGGSTVRVRGRNAATGVYGYSAAVYVQSGGNGTPGCGDRWRQLRPALLSSVPYHPPVPGGRTASGHFPVPRATPRSRRTSRATARRVTRRP